MQRKTSTLAFNGAAPAQADDEGLEGLTFLIRTDARYSTDGFRRHLLRALLQDTQIPVFNGRAAGECSNLETAIMKSVHEAYQEWGHTVLESISRHVNYDLYDIANSMLLVDFHNSTELTEKIADNADKYVRALPGVTPDTPVVYVSLDEMFQECRSPWAEIAFSRLFSVKGDQQFGYTARPGKSPIDDQVKAFADQVKNLRDLHGENVKIIILEDNVRHAKMLNWVIDLMDQHKVFENGELACISTCFCSASEQERASIVYKGQSVPLVAAVEIESKSFEVSTPRDLFFDGYVVEIEGEKTRLPGLFMDVEKLFKVCPEKVEAFTEEIKEASQRFCQRIEREWGVKPLLSWFTGAKAIAAVTGKPQSTPMGDVLADMDVSMQRLQAPGVVRQDDPATATPVI